MSAVALKDLRQAIANRIHTRTHELSRKLTDQEIRSKQHVPEASSVPIPVAKYVHDDKVIDLTHSEIESEPTSVHKKYIPWSPLDYIPPRQLKPNSLLHCFANKPTTNRRHRFRVNVKCTITIDDDEVEDSHSNHRVHGHTRIQRPDTSNEEEYDPLVHD